MDDGNKTGSGFRISSSFSSYLKLIELLEKKFQLKCSLHIYSKKNNQYRIYIKIKSMNPFKSLVLPYFHESMLY